MNELWLIFLAAAAPIAAVVGFAIQIRTVRKVRLENTKLSLDIQRLQKTIEESERRLVVATTEETEKYGDPVYSRFRGPCPGPDEGDVSKTPAFVAAAGFFLILATVVLFVTYLIFDLYRVINWLWSFF